jgi:threonine/homoserine/homoserine lactone efflux protein
MGFGLSLAAPPGPVNAAMAHRTVTRSKLHGTLVGAGAMTTDATYFAITYLVHGFVPQEPGVRAALFALGSAFLVLLACLAYRGLAAAPRGLPSPPARPAGGFAYLVGLGLGFSNPLQMSWWATVGLGMMVNIGLAFVLGFFLGILVWILAFPLSLGLAHRRFKAIYSWVIAVSIVLMLIFAGWLALQAVLLLRP